jgi:hypothetical protein
MSEQFQNQNTTMLEQFQNPTSELYKEAKSIPLTHKYTTAHFPGLVQALHQKVGGINEFYGREKLKKN